MLRLLPVLALGITFVVPASASAAKKAWVSSNHIQVIDLDSAKVVGRIPLEEHIHDMEFSVDGASVFVASSHGLRVADAEKLEFVQKIDARPTSAISVSRGGQRIAAIHRADSESSQAARLAGLPLPPSEIVIYAAQGLTVEHSFHVSGNALDVVLSPDGETAYVLVPHDGNVYAHALNGDLQDTFEIVDQSQSHGSMMSELALSPDGTRLVVPVTDIDQSWIADVDLAATREPAERILKQELGHARRVQGVSWDEDGSGVYVSAVRAVVKFDRVGLPVAWKRFPANYVDVEPIPGLDQTVMVTPTFSEKRGSGGVAIVDADGTVLRTVELPDMSPFVVAVQP